MRLCDILKGKDTFSIGFIGGSITEGAHASTKKNRYSSQTVALLSERYPDVAFTEINAGVGGTGSNLGLFRANRDLLSKEPDMIFVEFTVNDSATYTERYHEALVRLFRAYRKDIPIVFVYTLNRPIYADYYAKGILGPVAQKVEAIAAHYGIPSVPVAIALCQEMQDESQYSTYMTDGVHPNDKGHAVYAKTIVKALEDAEFTVSACERMFPLVCENPHLDVIAENDFCFEGWTRSHNHFYGKFPTYLYAWKPGTVLEYPFYGTAIGLYHTVEKDSGSFSYSIDDGEWESRSTWDEYALQFNRICYTMLRDDLKEGHHVLKLRIADEAPEKSEGTYIRIGAFLVG